MQNICAQNKFLNTFLSRSVVFFPFLFVTQDVVSLYDSVELFFCIWASISVGMTSFGHLIESRFDFLRSGGRRNSQTSVKAIATWFPWKREELSKFREVLLTRIAKLKVEFHLTDGWMDGRTDGRTRITRSLAQVKSNSY